MAGMSETDARPASDELEPSADAVLRVLRAAGIVVPAEVLWSVDELAGHNLPDALATLERAGLISWDGDGGVTVTPRGQARAHTAPGVAERARLRGSVGRAARLSRSVSAVDIAELLLDGCRVRPDPTVVPWLLERADHEIRQGRLDEAAAVLSAIVLAIDRGHVVTGATRIKAFARRSFVLRWLGRGDEAQQVFERAVAVARSTGNPVDLAAAAVTWRPDAINVTDDPYGVALIDEALAVAPDDELSIKARLLAARAEALVFTDLDASQSAAASAVAVARHSGDPEAFILSAYAYRVAHWHPSRQQEMLALGSEMVAASPGAIDCAEYGAVTRLQVFLELGDWPHFDGELAALGRRLSGAPRPADQLWWRTLVAARAGVRGDWSEFERENDAAMRLAQLAQHVPALQLLASQQLIRSWQRGDDLRPLGSAAVLEALPVGAMRTSWEAALLGWTCTRVPRVDVVATLDRLLDRGVRSVRPDLTFGPVMSSLATAAVESRAVSHARVLYDALLPYADQWAGTGGAVVAGPYAFHLGRLASVLDRPAAALELLTAARDNCVAGQCHAWEARVELALAVASQSHDDQRRHGRRSADLAARLGMVEVEHAARRLLGTDARPAGLSRREVEVLVLAARGATNQEIAAELYLSTKTVERHLLNGYRKVGARNRADAIRFALQELVEND
jgi:DNA-binding CsgD family transcriptional regulator